MKKLGLLLLVIATPAIADVMIHDNKKTVTVDCAKDKVVHIHGNDAKVTLKGTCDSIMLSGNNATVTGSVANVNLTGNKNKLDLDATLDLKISGNDNTVGYKKSTDDKRKVNVADSGKGNRVMKEIVQKLK